MDVYDEVSRLMMRPLDSDFSAKHVDVAGGVYGGDKRVLSTSFYDLTMLPDGRLAIVVAEQLSGYQYTLVCMYGVRCVLQVLMSMGVGAREALTAANDSLLRQDPDGCRHVIVHMVLLDPTDRTVVHAGSNELRPILRGAGGATRLLAVEGLVLGVNPEAEFEVSPPIHLDPGDVLLTCTLNSYGIPSGDECWESNFIASLSNHAPGAADARSILDGLLADFDRTRRTQDKVDFAAVVIRANA